VNENTGNENVFPSDVFGAAVFATFPAIISSVFHPMCTRIWAMNTAGLEVPFPLFGLIHEKMPWIGFAISGALISLLIVMHLFYSKKYSVLTGAAATVLVCLLYLAGIVHGQYFSGHEPEKFKKKFYLIAVEIAEVEFNAATGPDELVWTVSTLMDNPHPRALKLLRENEEYIVSKILAGNRYANDRLKLQKRLREDDTEDR